MKSTAILNVLLIGAMCLALTSAKRQNIAKFRADNSLMEFMLNTRAVQAKAPLRSMQCFNYYTPLLNDITAKYESDYEACLKASDASLSAIDDASAAERKNLNTVATTSCSAIANCNAITDSISAFECYEGVSNTNSKDFYGISTSASEELLNIREEYRQIELSEYRCTNASERAYVQSTSETYDQLQSCLTGLTPVPTTTVAPVTEVPTTEPVVLTTEEVIPSEAPSTEVVPSEEPLTSDTPQAE